MTHRRDWFDTYQSISGSEVLMGNNVTCKVMGVGATEEGVCLSRVD